MAEQNRKDSGHQTNRFWASLADMPHEARPIGSVRELLVKGRINVYVRRGQEPKLVVAGTSVNAIAEVSTRFTGDKLVVETLAPQDSRITATIKAAPGSIEVNAGSIHIQGDEISFGADHLQINTGSVHVQADVIHFGRMPVQISGRDIINNETVRIQSSGERTLLMGVNGACHYGTISSVMVGIELPEVPFVELVGPSDIYLVDINQDRIKLTLTGSGDIAVSGRVTDLEASVVGSGEIDAIDLVAERATLTVTGSGDIRAFAEKEADARVVGSGDIEVRGQPPIRSKSRVGSGSIKFR